MRKRVRNGKTTRTDLALAIHELLDMPLNPITKFPSEGAKILNIILATMKEALLRGETIRIPGFGTFKVRKYRERYNVPRPALFNNGHFGHHNNTYSDEQQWYPGHKKVFFTPSIHLTAMLNLDNPSPRERSKAIDNW